MFKKTILIMIVIVLIRNEVIGLYVLYLCLGRLFGTGWGHSNEMKDETAVKHTDPS